MPFLLEIGEGDDAVLIQALPPTAARGGARPINRDEQVVEKLDRTLAQVLSVVGQIAKDFETAVTDAPVSSAVLEFGLQMTAKGKLYVVEAEAQGSIKVTLTVAPGQS